MRLLCNADKRENLWSKKSGRAVAVIIIVVIVVVGAYFVVPRPMTPTASTTSTTSSIQNPNTIVQEMINPPDLLDPGVEYLIPGTSITQNVYEQLLWFHGSAADQVIPWLAQSYDVSSDGLTYTFHLRNGITFTDGTPFNATAVYYSLMRVMLIDDADGPAWALLQVLRGGMNYSKQYNNAGPSAPKGYGNNYTQGELQDFLNAKPVEIIDPMTVALHLERPYAGFPFIMAFAAAIVSPTAFTAHWTAPTDGTPYINGVTCGDYHDQYNSWPSENMVGTGPYMLQSWDKGTQTIILVRNQNYWGGPFQRGVAPVQYVIIKAGIDTNTRVLDLESGAADIGGLTADGADNFPGGTIFQFVDKDTWFNQDRLVSVNPDWQVFPTEGLWPQLLTQGIAFNQKILDTNGNALSFQPFSDVRIRKAFVLSFNRTAYLHDILQNLASAATQIIPPGMFGYDSSIPPTPYDPQTAKALLIDAGAHPITPSNAFSPQNPKTVSVLYDITDSSREAAATLIATTINSFSNETGLTATPVGLSEPQMHTERRTHTANLFFASWTVDYVDPDDFLVPFASASGGFYTAFTSYNNSEVNTLVSEQAKTLNATLRQQMISQIDHLVNNDWEYLWIHNGGTYTISQSWLHERANASVASGLSSYNPAIDGYYYYEMEKGQSTSPSSSAVEPSLLALIGLPAIALFNRKNEFSNTHTFPFFE
jgi:peptide/nickel transport system substrate-binding protein